MMMERLRDLAEREGVAVEEDRLPRPFRGRYLGLPGEPLILLDEEEAASPRGPALLAHELGHHFAGATYCSAELRRKGSRHRAAERLADSCAAPLLAALATRARPSAPPETLEGVRVGPSSAPWLADAVHDAPEEHRRQDREREGDQEEDGAAAGPPLRERSPGVAKQGDRGAQNPPDG